MLVRRCLISLACGALMALGLALQSAPGDVVMDACRWLQHWSGSCPAWLFAQNIPPAAPWVCFAMAALGLLFVVSSLLSGLFVQPPEAMLAQFIQRGRDLHERCRKEGDQAVMPDIHAWTDEVSKFLRRLGHRYLVLFGDFGGIQLFASQYDTAATLEIRQRIHRLSEFMQRFHPGGGPAERELDAVSSRRGPRNFS
jgi:hypothetical protein